MIYERVIYKLYGKEDNQTIDVVASDSNELGLVIAESIYEMNKEYINEEIPRDVVAPLEILECISIDSMGVPTQGKK
jgi:hypothetical protein